MVYLLLLACTAKPEGGETGETATEDTGNPVVPEEYAYLWDVEAEDCAASGADAAVYYLYTGEIDADGGVTGQEAWYWFFATEGWEGDCVDTFTVTGDSASHGWADDACSGCERLFDARWDLDDADRTCGAFDYEGFWDQEDVDADRFDTSFLLDALSPSGNPNSGNQMLVVTVWENGDGELVGNLGYARGHYYPAVEGDYEGAASIDWVADAPYCVEITEE